MVNPDRGRTSSMDSSKVQICAEPGRSTGLTLSAGPSNQPYSASNKMYTVEHQSDVLSECCHCSASRQHHMDDICALSYLSAKQLRCRVRWLCRTMQARTGRWNAPKGSEFKCVHFSQSYGVILLLLGIIDGGLLPPIIKRLLRLRYASLCKSSSSISNTANV